MLSKNKETSFISEECAVKIKDILKEYNDTFITSYDSMMSDDWVEGTFPCAEEEEEVVIDNGYKPDVIKPELKNKKLRDW